MKLLKYLFILAITAISFGSADAQINVRIGQRPRHRRVVVVRRPMHHRYHHRRVVVRHY